MTLQVFKTIDGIGLYVKYAVRKLDARASLYTSSSLCIHTCKSKCLLIASGAPWYVTGRYTRMCVPLFANHIRALNSEL